MDDYAMGGWWIPLPCTSPCPTTPVSSPSCRRRPPEHTGYTTISTTPFRNAYRAQLRSCQCWLRVDLRGVLQISVRSLAAHLLSPFHIPPSAAMAGFLPYVPACRVGAYRRTGWRGACQTPPKKMGRGTGGCERANTRRRHNPTESPGTFVVPTRCLEVPSRCRYSPLHLPSASARRLLRRCTHPRSATAISNRKRG